MAARNIFIAVVVLLLFGAKRLPEVGRQVGAHAVVSYSVTVSNPDTGDKILVNSVSSDAMGSTCPPGSLNAACTTCHDARAVDTQALDEAGWTLQVKAMVEKGAAT